MKKIRTPLLVAVIIVISIVVYGKLKRNEFQNPFVNIFSDTKRYEINTTEWTVIKTGKKDFDLNIVEPDGRKLKWFIKVNSLDNKAHPMPPVDDKTEGLGFNIRTLYVCLAADQFVTTAEVTYKEK